MKIKNIWLSIGVALFVAVTFVDSGYAYAVSIDETSQMEISILKDHGFQEWKWPDSNCENCQIMLVPTQNQVRTENVRRFIQALAMNKADLQKLYKIGGEEYTLLAHISVGILGRETLFGESARYKLKEAAPWAVSLAKLMRALSSGKDVDENSRGLTQIKFLPQAVVDKYGITSDNLDIPENAAIATMGYLIEALRQLKHRIKINDLSHITPDKYADYLPYIYFGRTGALINKTAIPDQNAYVIALRKYMAMIQVYERP
ncbi:hypothetical protein [Bdellovibrio sp. HCB209]|uniref:hypothetical protein n=1 Tax=Bdellovibrio sp. HCB209 TaxID=3394354 RepID=UPI0039B596A4